FLLSSFLLSSFLLSSFLLSSFLLSSFPPSSFPPFLLSSFPPSSPTDLAHAHGLPVLEVGSLRAPASLAALDSLAPDLICVACFPRLLPPAWLARPRLGCLNLHPSLLPAYRGPAPLFWQFRAGERRTGVTLHRMDAGADTGPILAQAPVRFPDGVRGPQADRLAGEAGAQLLLAALSRLEAGGALPPGQAQGAGGSRQPWPGAADRVISTAWPARRAFNFIRGAGEWGPFELVDGERRLPAREALAWSPPAQAGEGWVRFADGAYLRLMTA
ncbi:MAG: hypothetical protein HY784_06195, partial [Chloroflexi bacterium]|nr:hypothetical protein [Chloroflexota bacterium]